MQVNDNVNRLLCMLLKDEKAFRESVAGFVKFSAVGGEPSSGTHFLKITHSCHDTDYERAIRDPNTWFVIRKYADEERIEMVSRGEADQVYYFDPCHMPKESPLFRGLFCGDPENIMWEPLKEASNESPSH